MLARSGVEVEFCLDLDEDDEPFTDEILSALADQGIVAAFEHYNHELRSDWKLTTDSSCGFELVSPILTKHSARSITGAMRGITNGGGVVDNRCGLHVHVELPEEFRDAYAATQAIGGFYHRSYEVFSPIFHPDRARNSYCQWNEDYDTFLRLVANERYSAVNVQCLTRQPTVEFRQLQGTLDASLAFAWMHLADALVAEATQPQPSVDKFRRRLQYATPTDVTDALVKRGLKL